MILAEKLDNVTLYSIKPVNPSFLELKSESSRKKLRRLPKGPRGNSQYWIYMIKPNLFALKAKGQVIWTLLPALESRRQGRTLHWKMEWRLPNSLPLAIKE